MLQSVLLGVASGANGDSGIMSILMMVAIFAIFYFFMIRPQSKERKKIEKFRASLEVGEDVETTGGLCGKIREISDNYVMLEIAASVKVKISKVAILPTVDSASTIEKK